LRIRGEKTFFITGFPGFIASRTIGKLISQEPSAKFELFVHSNHDYPAGDSQTGETARFDGPYFIMSVLDKFSKLLIPYLGKGEGEFNLVPVDYIVGATCFPAINLRGGNKVYHLTGLNPYKARGVYRFICEALTGQTPKYMVFMYIVSSLLSVPAFQRWVMVEKETINYF